ncbi:hypothetical protein SAMN06298216_0167 [Spirosomataceae bacterium TFI 002]|nr:hypothetical protein SAMN06298216_0167 [Spirosomataceae bacterium TFI 002]
MTLSEEKLILESTSFQKLLDSNIDRRLKIVAEGDSWFDYPLHKDILDYLRKKGYAINKLSKAGDTLENMVYNPESIDDTVAKVKLYQPQFLLLSAGGNDVVGQEMGQFLHHKSSSLPTLFNKEMFTSLMVHKVRSGIIDFIDKVLVECTDIKIVMHGYDYAKPTGKGFKFAGVKFSGPWIKPAFNDKGITRRKGDIEPIIKEMVDIFNEVLKSIEAEYNGTFHYVDLRGRFPDDSEWHNEIHLKNDGFKTIANEFDSKMVSIQGAMPIFEPIIV